MSNEASDTSDPPSKFLFLRNKHLQFDLKFCMAKYKFIVVLYEHQVDGGQREWQLTSFFIVYRISSPDYEQLISYIEVPGSIPVSYSLFFTVFSLFRHYLLDIQNEETWGRSS